jgi:hypothetical protein
MTGVLDAFAWSSALVGCAALALAAAASRALDTPAEPAVLAFAFCGTVVVYCFDRLHDVEHDRASSPLRSSFIDAHWRPVVSFAEFAVAASFPTAFAAGPRVVAIAATVAGFGLAHRQLKQFAWAKPLYLTGSWTAVTVGMPAVAADGVELARVAWVAGVIALAVQANVVLSNLRDREGLAGRLPQKLALAIAGGFALFSLALVRLGPREIRPLAAIPLAMILAVAAYQPGERYGAIVVDGALIAGGLAALALP